MSKRSYSDSEKATALAYLESCGGNYQRAARSVGVPWTTLRDWERGDGVSSDVPFLQRKSASELLDALRDKASLLVSAITPNKIEDAPLTGITVALGVVIDKIRCLESAQAVMPEELARREAAYAEIIARHVTDADTLAKIAADLERIGDPDSPEIEGGQDAAQALRPLDTDEGE